MSAFPNVPAPSSNGRRSASASASGRPERPARGIASGVAAGTVIAALWIPRLLLLNLSTYNPWPRPVAVAAITGALTGVSRRGSARGAAIAGAVAGTLALVLTYSGVRLSVPVLWIDRSPVRVVATDLLRLAAYAVVPAALAGAAGRRARAWTIVARNKRAARKPPIRSL